MLGEDVDVKEETDRPSSNSEAGGRLSEGEGTGGRMRSTSVCRKSRLHPNLLVRLNDGAVKRLRRRNTLAGDQIRAATHLLRATAGNSKTDL